MQSVRYNGSLNAFLLMYDVFGDDWPQHKVTSTSDMMYEFAQEFDWDNGTVF